MLHTPVFISMFILTTFFLHQRGAHTDPYIHMVLLIDLAGY